MARRRRKLNRRILLLVASLVLILAVLGLGWARYHKTAAPATNTNTQSSASTSSPSSTTSPKTTLSGGGSSASSANLIAPYGSFVSNHHASLSSQEESACVTSPGATCYIEFISGNSTEKLDSKTTGSDGSIYWNWKASDIGLYKGSWQIKATASLNGQTKSTTDQIPLEVQP